jgi:hypothetical protein
MASRARAYNILPFGFVVHLFGYRKRADADQSDEGETQHIFREGV